MVAGKRQSIDSVFVKANASMDSLVEKEVLQDADTYTDQLKGDDKESKADGNEVNNNTVSSVQNKRVQQHHAWKEKAYKGMPGARVNKKDVEKGDEKYERRYLSNHTHFSTTDADARVSVKPGKPRQLNYLGQVSTDTAHHVITNIEAPLCR